MQCGICNKQALCILPMQIFVCSFVCFLSPSFNYIFYSPSSLYLKKYCLNNMFQNLETVIYLCTMKRSMDHKCFNFQPVQSIFLVKMYSLKLISISLISVFVIQSNCAVTPLISTTNAPIQKKSNVVYQFEPSDDSLSLEEPDTSTNLPNSAETNEKKNETVS